MTDLPVEVGEFEVEEAAGEAAEAQVRTEAGGAGEQRVGVHSGTLEVGHPRLKATHDQIWTRLDSGFWKAVFAERTGD